MAEHARLSPSKRHRWSLCPGSVREEAKYPDDRSPAAVDGTHTHTLLEYCVKQTTDPLSMVGQKMTDDDGEFTVDTERAKRVKVAIDYVYSRVAALNGMARVITECRVDPRLFTNRDDLSGTVDIQIVGKDVLEIIDYKDGMGEVAAEENPQLEQYAIGKLAECKLGTNVAEQYPWQQIRMTIIQPKLAVKGMNPISTWIVPTAHLLSRVSTLLNQALATDDPDAPLVPGQSQCKFCKARGACGALADNVMKEVGVAFQPPNIESLEISQQFANKDPGNLTNQQIRQIIEATPLVRQLLEGVEKEAQRRLELGLMTESEGIKLVNGRGSRSWALPEEEMADKLMKMGIPKSAIYETKLVSPAKAEKLTWTKRDGTQVSLTERQLKRMAQEYVVTSAGKLTVVPESDSRPAVIMNTAHLFSAVEAVSTAVSAQSGFVNQE